MKKILCIVMAICVAMLPFYALAEGTANVSIALDRQSVRTGERFHVKIVFQADKEGIGVIEAAFHYDSSVLRCTTNSNTVHVSDGSGTISDMPGGETRVEYDLTFVALKSTKTTISIESAEIIGYTSGNTLGSPSDSLTVAVAPSASLPSAAAPQTAAPSDLAASSLPAEGQTPTIEVDAVLYAVSEENFPLGYFSKSISQIEGAVCNLWHLDGNAYLLLSDTQQNYYLYNIESAALIPYLLVTGAVMMPADKPKMPALLNLTPQTLFLDGLELTGYLTPDGYYLLYLENTWYYYDSVQNTHFPAAVSITEAEQTPEPAASQAPVGTSGNASLFLVILGLLGATVVALTVTVLVLAFRRKNR